MEDNTKNFRDWAVVLTDDEFRKGIKAAHSNMGNGILIQRTLGMDYTKKKYIEALSKCYSSQKDKDEIKRRSKMDAKELEHEGIYNIYGPDVARAAYKEGKNPFDPKFMEEYAKKFKEKNVSDKNKDDEDNED